MVEDTHLITVSRIYCQEQSSQQKTGNFATYGPVVSPRYQQAVRRVTSEKNSKFLARGIAKNIKPVYDFDDSKLSELYLEMRK